MPKDSKERGRDSVLLTFLLGLLLFASPLRDWLLSLGLWYLPYLAWFGLIVVVAVLQRLRIGYDL